MKYQIETQLSVFLQNAPGKVAELTETLASHNINISALTLNEGQTQGVIRFTASDPQAAETTLRGQGYTVSVDEVLSIRMQDSKGRLAGLAKALFEARIDIDYMYASVDEAGAGSRLILKVSNIPLAARIMDELLTAA